MLKSALNVALLIGVVLSLLAATLLFGGILVEHALPWYLLVGLAVSLWAVKLILCRHVSGVWSPMHVPVLLFAGYAFARYLVSPIEYESRVELFHIGIYTLIYFLVACNFHRTRDRLIIGGALVLLAVGESIYGMWQCRADADSVLWLDRGDFYHGRGSGTFFCPNHLAGFLAIGLGLLVARFLVSRAPNQTLQFAVLVKLYETAAVVIVVLGLVATLSRGGWISLSVALFALLVWAELAKVLSSRTVIAAFLVLVVAIGVAWSVPRIRQRIEQDIRLQWEFVPGDTPIHVVSGFSGRYPIWQATVKMVADHVWLGTGPGTWEWMHLKYREPRLQIRPRFAHHDVLQLLSDYGVIGAALVVALLACFYWHAWQLARRAESAEQRGFALGAGTAVLAILVHSFGDFNLHIPANTLWLVTLMGLTVAQSVNETDRRRSKLSAAGRCFLGATLLAMAALLVTIGWTLNHSARDTARGYDESQQFEWDVAQACFERALHYDARNPETYAQMGDAHRIHSAQFSLPGDQPERQRLALLAVDAYRRSLALNPFQSEVLLRQASAYELAGDTAGAARAYNDALSVDPNNAFVWLRVGMFYRRQGEMGRAVEALQYSHRLNSVEPIVQKLLEEIAAESAGKP